MSAEDLTPAELANLCPGAIATSPAATFPKVQGRCPMCHSESLFLGEGGYVTCSLRGCADPTEASSVLGVEFPVPEEAPDPVRGERLQRFAEELAIHDRYPRIGGLACHGCDWQSWDSEDTYEEHVALALLDGPKSEVECCGAEHGHAIAYVPCLRDKGHAGDHSNPNGMSWDSRSET